jgi:hypothetical protein
LLLREYAGRVVCESSVGLDMRELERAGAADSELRYPLQPRELLSTFCPLSLACRPASFARLTRALIRLLHVSPPIRDQRDESGRLVPWHEAALAGYTPPPDTHHDALSSREPVATAHGVAAAVEPRFFDGVVFNAQIHIKELLLLRSERLALLQTTFPPIHWASMALLGGSIVVAFLIESDEQARPPQFSLHHSPPSST